MNMKMLKAALAGLVLSVSGFANAGLILEIGDTGDNLNTAQSLTGGTTQVSGSISTNNDVDLFSFYWGGGLLDLNVSQDNSALDTQIFLFDSLGFGLFHNDDAPFPNSIIQTALAAGEYFVGISSWSNDPLSVGGAIFPSDFSGQLTPTGPGGASSLSTWEYDGNSSGAYLLNISSTASQVPEPSTLAIFALGIMGLASRKFKKQS
ncbi:DVUA0089 family protein [Colwellia psychrerythraea]|uniref:Ice-binding protein C-terminal domain-containing protein n=1 Tax=Colwellia psychrerythraea (strain 34H / ATCC BAA-681) TaxID=167879 RepID=Q489X7_COLP3|nr:DVUA0089 family protein [Colwellia psychrerythraea]AAZ25965.1 hypothetical protein CPS_0379 [Colwellia psychrerythraea 34H]